MKIRRRFLVTSLASAAIAIVLFGIGSFVMVMIEDGEADMRAGDSFRSEVGEIVLGAMAIVAPLALVAAGIVAVVLSRRSAKPIEDAIRAARATTAHDLRRTLPVPAHDDELRELVIALNELFARLDDGFGALARFAADASHELRTPLAVMATELEVALRHPRPAAEWEATARTALDELRRLSAVVEGLLALARAGADAPDARAQVRVVECVDAVVAQLSSRAEDAGVSLVGPADDNAAAVPGNSVMLETAIRNLVVNAIAAAREVRVSVAPSSSEVSVVVDDNGPGLGADPEQLFAPFRRGTGGGVGLGLAIARSVAVAHGGRLTAEQSPLGGARFTLAVPIAK